MGVSFDSEFIKLLKHFYLFFLRKINFIISWFNDLSIIGETTDRAILGLSSLEAGHRIINFK